MTPDETREAAQVMLAFAEGQRVQRRRWACSDWSDWVGCVPAWDWETFEYRVKPKPREWWVSVNEQGEAICVRSEKPNMAGGVCDHVKVREVMDE